MATRFSIVYEGEHEEICQCVHELQVTLEVHGKWVKTEKLQDWNDKDEHVQTVLFVADAEREDFHTKVRGKFVKTYKNSYVVLTYPLELEQEVKRSLKHIKTELKEAINKSAEGSRTSDDVNNALARIEKVTNITNVSSWLPKILREVCKPPKNTPSAKKEFAVFFKINLDSEAEMAWFGEQRTILEKVFELSCRYDNGEVDEDRYIKYSTCVAMFVQSSINFSDSLNQGNLDKINEEKIKCISTMRTKCEAAGCTLLVFLSESNKNLETQLEVDLAMTLEGTNGLTSYWLCLLNVLGQVNVVRQPDQTLYSDVCYEQPASRFNPERERYKNVFSQVSSQPATNIPGQVRSLADLLKPLADLLQF
ncbi:uncharacterized protein LOC128212242 isoform X2 [Mya arenaria]|uniref:uncharacterized protein LOC128212242 isoform X2 n=1 Tax=Mya arenaria TaxID=6604 RepID=UPI0022E6EE6B|nr:uncharacterized protein LOC128212242 isoform X2 [Mya arenaria]